MTSNNNAAAEMMRLFPENAESGCLTVACAQADYSASLIARAVEDADAHLLNLNVTSATGPLHGVVVELRVSHRDTSSVARSLSRHGYTILAADSDCDGMQPSERYNPYAALVRYLEI